MFIEGTDTHGVNNSNVNDDFLTRERAALGDDADFFTSANDNTVSANAQEEDLLGGDYSGGQHEGRNTGEEITEFESSFPAVNTHNEVRIQVKLFMMPSNFELARCSWRYHHRPRPN